MRKYFKVYSEKDLIKVVRAIKKKYNQKIFTISGELGVGKTTLTKSLSLLRPRGSLISFGQSSGSPPSINPLDLQKQGSIYLTRPTLASYIQDANELEKRAKNLFKWIDDGKLNIRIDRQLDIDDAQEAHRLLESRSTAGKMLLRIN